MIYITNAFALSMLPSFRTGADGTGAAVTVLPVADPAAWLMDAEARHGQAQSAVGHTDTAGLFSEQLGRKVAANRISIAIDGDMELLVGQYIGPRLPEGVTTLPAGASIRWMAVTLDDVGVS